MRAFIPAYEMRTPRELPEALALLESGWKPFAGGTDLMVLLEQGKLPQRRFVSLWDLASLRGIHVDGENVTLGALTTYTEIQGDRVRVVSPGPLDGRLVQRRDDQVGTTDEFGHPGLAWSAPAERSPCERGRSRTE